MAQGGLTRARAALNDRGSLPVEQLSGPVPYTCFC